MTNIKNYFKSSRKSLVSSLLVLTVVVSCILFTGAAVREITFIDDGATITFRTTKNTVGEVLSDTGIILNEYDSLSVDPETLVSDVEVVKVRRARDIKIKDANKEVITVKSSYETAREILDQYMLFPGEYDEITFENGLITVTRVFWYTQTIPEEVPFETIYEEDPELFEGEEVVSVEGVNGMADVLYYDQYINGEFIQRVQSTKTVTLEPVNKVVKVGTKERYPDAPPSYKKVMTFRATAYDGSYETLGYYNCRTCLGAVPTVGTVAVDPKIIPLGTKMFITAVDGSYNYGYCFAGDTGGAIKGDRVDLFMASRQEALNFGRRDVYIYILE